MASGPMQKCCVTGVKHEGTPAGEVKSIESIPTYITHPPNNANPQHAILILTDVLGFAFPNVRLIADQFAANGYLTVIPDLFNGNEVPWPVPADFSLQEYIDTKMPRTGAVDPIVEKIVAWLRGEMGVKRIGGVGYCFGGKYVCRWLKEGGLNAGFTGHPSFVDADELKGIQGPLSIAAAETDNIFTVAKRHESEDILAKHTVPYQIFLYSDVEHGFAVKGDMSTAKAKFAKEQAFLQAVGWFDEYIKKV